MKPNTERPEACAIGDKVHIFVGGSHQVMSVEAAETLITKISEAIAQAKARTSASASASEEPTT